MPTVTVSPLSDLSGPAFTDRMEDGNNDSLFVPLRGHLDINNLDASTSVLDPGIPHTKLQRGELAKVWTASGTANLDYRRYWFEGVDSTTWGGTAETDPGPRALDIPGGSQTIYVPEAGPVMLDWNIMWTNDASSDDGRSWIFLRIDGDTVDGQRRAVGITVATDHAAGAVLFPGYGQHSGVEKNRVWSGHHLAFLTAGYHNVGLAVASGNGSLNTRVWVRSMRAAWLGPST